ncbi:phage head closure protein [Methylobrevis albus]|uniref:Phage head closure protein n=1 Tax=Methylobrevis albus TaxID=2793297 RepID=A0A931MXI6_9HYPH|nr:phage head closure protein [Methylobrevis albus]MBH0239123.1 phage head closure protein [Methylobrevis albus]
MKAGTLDRRIVIQRLVTDSVTEYNEPITSWQEIATVWASYTQDSATERDDGRQRYTEVTSTFRIRWLGGITERDRIIYDGQTFGIASLKEIGRREGLEIVGRRE